MALLAGWSLLYLAGTGLLASRKLLGNDELLALYIARLPSLSDLWSALLTGAEQSPPFFHLVTRGALRAFGEDHLAVRLPGLIGFWTMGLCLFRFASRRSTALYGCVAMLFPVMTSAYLYAYAARPYGLLLGLAGLSLVCWQMATEGSRRTLALVGLAVSLTLGVASHYYAVLAVAPLAVGELVRTSARRRLDAPVWIALGVAMIPLLLSLPLLEGARAYAPTFWAKPQWTAMVGFYRFLLEPGLLPLTAALVVLAVYLTSRPYGPDAEVQAWRSPPPHEMAAVYGFMGIPVLGVLLAKVATGAFTERYALPAVIGLSILFAWAGHRATQGRALTGVALALILCGWFVLKVPRDLERFAAASAAQGETYDFLRARAEQGLPIAISDPHLFIRLAYYAPPDLAGRLVYLADPEESVRYRGSDTADRGLLALKDWRPVRVERYTTFVASGQRLLLYGPTGSRAWVYRKLSEDGVPMEVRAWHGHEPLFLVNPGSPP